MMGAINVAFVKYTEKARKAYMFEYGENVYIHVGDTVIVLNPDGDEVEATVIATERYAFNSKYDKEELERLLMVAGVEMPFRKIKGRVTREYFDYEEEKDEE